MLCLRTDADDPLCDEVLRHFQATAVYDARQAVRSARIASYDVYLADDPGSLRKTLRFWTDVRRLDPNTPFVMVCRSQPGVRLAARLRSGFDACLQDTSGPVELLRTIRRLLVAAERRNAEAREEEARAVAEDLKGHLASLEQRVRFSRQTLARAQEHVVRAHALRIFSRAGGTRSHFDRRWQEIFEAVLTASYDPGSGGEPTGDPQ